MLAARHDVNDHDVNDHERLCRYACCSSWCEWSWAAVSLCLLLVIMWMIMSDCVIMFAARHDVNDHERLCRYACCSSWCEWSWAAVSLCLLLVIMWMIMSGCVVMFAARHDVNDHDWLCRYACCSSWCEWSWCEWSWAAVSLCLLLVMMWMIMSGCVVMLAARHDVNDREWLCSMLLQVDRDGGNGGERGQLERTGRPLAKVSRAWVMSLHNCLGTRLPLLLNNSYIASISLANCTSGQKLAEPGLFVIQFLFDCMFLPLPLGSASFWLPSTMAKYRSAQRVCDPTRSHKNFFAVISLMWYVLKFRKISS